MKNTFKMKSYFSLFFLAFSLISCNEKTEEQVAIIKPVKYKKIGYSTGNQIHSFPGVVKAEFIALMGACIIPIALVQVTLGLQNISFAKVNDLTTSVENPPMFNQSRDRRLLGRDTSVFGAVF